MSNTRIKDLSSSASLPASDDYLVIDGDTNGTRKIKPADLKTGNELTSDIRDALLQIAEKVAYIDDQGQSYYDDLYNALYYTPPATLLSISAVYTQSGTVYDTTSLDNLKSDLVVTASYDDGTTATVTTYTLSGTLTVGTSTITVNYGGKSATFDVVVSEGGVPSAYQMVEYVGFDGNSRIVPNCEISNDLKFIARLGVHQATSEECMFGIVTGYAVRIEIGTSPTANRMFVYTSNSLAITNIADFYSYPADIEVDYEYNVGRALKVTVNNQEYSTSDSESGVNVDSTTMKFVIGSGGFTQQRMGYYGKVYAMKVYSNDIMTCNLIPCYRKSDDVIGFYDKVSNSFFTNAGSGTFTKGADI